MLLARIRPALVLVHRWLGLVMAGFLIVAAITGSLLVWDDELDATINPALFHVNEPARQEPHDPLLLRTSVLAHYAHAQIAYVPLERRQGEAVRFRLQADVDEKNGKPFVLEMDEVFVDPFSGAILGARKWGDITQGMINLMPFIYRLHYSLALDVIGTYLLGIIALLWSIDCFIGAVLTLPAASKSKGKGKPPAKSWWSRWMPAWRVRWLGGSYKLNVDLHRAGGLWAWAALFVLAWSSVAFNLPQVYTPIMRALFTHADRDVMRMERSPSGEGEVLSWMAARAAGRKHMADFAHKAGFSILAEGAIAYLPRQAVYRYDVRSTLDVRDHGSKTRVFVDAHTGDLLRTDQPTGRYAEETIRMWLTSLHMAALWGWPFRVFVCLMGLVVAMLCVTGIVIWNKKRKGRQARSSQNAAAMVTCTRL